MKTTIFLLSLFLAFINISNVSSQGTPAVTLCSPNHDCSIQTRTPVCGHLITCPSVGPCRKTYATACDACADSNVSSYSGGACPNIVYCTSPNADTAAGPNDYVCAYFKVSKCSPKQKWQQMIGGKTACSNPKVKYYTIGKCL